MKLTPLIEEDLLDLELLTRTSDVKSILESGEAIMRLNQSDSTEMIGKLIKQALFHADGALIKIRLSK